jgi:hypothetical protein
MSPLVIQGMDGCLGSNSMTENNPDPFDVNMLDPEAKAFFERHIREPKALQQDIRQTTARLKARQDRQFGASGDGKLFGEE